MSARIKWIKQDTSGNAVAGRTITLHRYADDALIGTFTDHGNGEYSYLHTTTELVYLKDNGTEIPGTKPILHVADDVAIKTNLASTATGKGASLIGVEDSGLRYTGINLEAVLNEIKTAVELASTASGKGASLIGVYDVGAYFAGANVETVLAEIGAITSLLAGLTSSAAELNKLDGASANVTPANLNLLTASGETTLHYHDGRYYTKTEVGTSGIPQLVVGAAATDGMIKTPDSSAGFQSDLVLQPGKDGGAGNRADVLVNLNGQDTNADGGNLDVNCQGTGTGSNGDVRVKKNNGVFYPVVTTFELAELYDAATGADSFNFFYIDGGYTDGDPAGDPAATVKWQETSGTYVIHRRHPFWQLPGMKRIGIYVELKLESGGVKGYIKAAVSSAEAEIQISGTAYDDYILWVDLSELPAVSSRTKRELQISLAGDGTHNIYVNENYLVWGEK